MAKIFISFYNGILTSKTNSNECPIPCFYESFMKELQLAGNELFVYSHQDHGEVKKNIPSNLLSKIQSFSPDLAILFNNSFYDISTLIECPIIIYEVDSVFYYSNKEKIKENPNRYKFITPQSQSLDIIHEALGVDKKNICYIPFATSVKAENIAQNTNISFIGSKFALSSIKAAWSSFQNDTPSWSEIKQFSHAVKAIEADPFISKEELIKKLNITTPKIVKHLDIENIVWMLSNANRVQTLSNIADLGLELYGSEIWGTDLHTNPELALSYKNQLVYSLQHNQDIYNSSKICININHLQAKSGFSWRVCDVMASNGCLVSEYKPDFKQLFPNVNIPSFTNKFEAREVCLKLLHNENMRKDIVQQCQEIINEKYRFEQLLKQLESFIGVNLYCKNQGTSHNSNYILEIQTPLPSKKISPLVGVKLFMYSLLFLISTLPGINLVLKPTKATKKIRRKIKNI